MTRHLAVDLGASGGRVALGTIEDGRLSMEVLHRFPNHAIPLQGGLYWDALELWRQILHGLSLATLHGDVMSVGVNSWGVDYALIDDRKLDLMGPISHYRSPRNDGVMQYELARIGRELMYEETGLQFLPFNTVFQLMAQKRDLCFSRGHRFLMVPDFFHFLLSGVEANERTVASTTGLYNPKTRDWSKTIIERCGLDYGFSQNHIHDPGTDLGPLSDEVRGITGLRDTHVVLPASHDTASAVAAVPASGDDWAYVSSGTWSLIGIEAPEPIITEEAMGANLTNEAGVGGTTRLLKNVMGLWILQECRRAWDDVPYDELYADAEAADAGPTFDPDDARFLSPGLDMPERVCSACQVQSRAEIVRAIFDSLAQKTGDVLGALERVSGRTIRTVHIVGGGSQIEGLNRLIAKKTGRRVVAGPVEATLMGNLLVQAEACGSIAKGTIRDVVRAGTVLKTYEP